MTKAKEPKPEPKKPEPKAWHCDICGADLSVDVCPIDGKVKP